MRRHAEDGGGRREPNPAWAALLAGAVIAASCGRNESASIQRRLQQKPVAAVMEELSRAEYVPPADSLLTTRQVEMYLEVRERGDRIRETAAGQQKSDAADASATADLRAAQELHHNPKEYLWVRSRLLAAQTAEATRVLLRKMDLGREQLVARLRAERDRLADPVARAEAARQLAQLERGLQEAEPAVPRDVEANMRLLAPFRGRLARLQQLEQKAMIRAAAASPEAGGGLEGGGTAATGPGPAGRSNGH